MKREQYVLCLINLIGAMGYSFIAPLYPPMALEKNVSQKMCGNVFGIFALSQILVIIMTPSLIKTYGRKKLFLFGTFSNIFSGGLYAFLPYIDNYYLFIILSFFIRIVHGGGCGLTNVISYAITSTINTTEEMKTAMGYMELCWGGGQAIGPLLTSLFFYLGGYSFPFIMLCLFYVITSISICFLEIEECNEQANLSLSFIRNSSSAIPKDPPTFAQYLLYKDILLVGFAGMLQLTAITFFFPTLANYLIERFSVSIELSSIFFMLPMGAYFISLQFINQITNKFGLRLTMIIGFIFSFIGCFFIAPIPILPQSLITIASGMLITGAQNSLIFVPMFLSLSDFIKEQGANESEAGDLSSAIFNLFFNFADLLAPVFGAYLCEIFSFQISCYITGILCLAYSGIFYYSYKVDIQEFYYKKKLSLQENILSML